MNLAWAEDVLGTDINEMTTIVELGGGHGQVRLMLQLYCLSVMSIAAGCDGRLLSYVHKQLLLYAIICCTDYAISAQLSTITDGSIDAYYGIQRCLYCL